MIDCRATLQRQFVAAADVSKVFPQSRNDVVRENRIVVAVGHKFNLPTSYFQPIVKRITELKVTLLRHHLDVRVTFALELDMEFLDVRNPRGFEEKLDHTKNGLLLASVRRQL